MVVTWGDIGNQWAEGVEWCLVTVVELALHVLLDLLQWHVTRTLDECLYVLVPGTGNKLAHGIQLGKLGCIVGIGNTAWAQTIAQREGYVVLCHNVADIVEVLIEETFLVVVETPLAHDTTATAHDTAETAVGEMHVVATDAGMDGEVVNTLLALLDEGITEYLPVQILYLAVYLLQSLVDRHGSYRYRTVAHNPFTGFVDVVAGREVHQCIASPLARPYSLIYLFLDAGGSGRVTDVGIDLHEEVAADDHRFALRVVDVGRKNGTSAGNLITNILRGDMGIDAQLLAVHVLADSHILHLWSDDARLGISHLGDVLASLCTARQLDVLEAEVVEAMVSKALLAILAGNLLELLGIVAVENPLLAHSWQAFLQIYLIVRVAVRTAGIVDVNRSVWLCMWNAALILHNSRSEVNLGHSNLDLWEEFSLHIRLFSLGVSFLIVWHNFLKVKR